MTIDTHTATADEAKALIEWMRSVGHVERNVALDLIRQGRLTRLHIRYFRAAVTGQTFGEFRRLYEAKP